FDSTHSMDTIFASGAENPLKVLFLEDDLDDFDLAVRQLRKAGLNVSVKRVDSQRAFCDELDASPSLILADYKLPQFSGLEALRVWRERQLDIPFIVVTGPHSEEVAVECLKAGADDYILKSNLRRLPFAVQAAL